MSYVTPTSKSSGVLIDAVTWNQDVKDNIIALHSPPAVRAYHSTTETITTGGSGTALSFDSETYDTDSIHDTSTNNSRLTCQTAGVYLITGYIIMLNNDAGAEVRAEILLDGTSREFAHEKYNPTAGVNVSLTVAGMLKLSASQYIELRVFHNSAADKSVSSQSFTMTWIGEGV